MGFLKALTSTLSEEINRKNAKKYYEAYLKTTGIDKATYAKELEYMGYFTKDSQGRYIRTNKPL